MDKPHVNKTAPPERPIARQSMRRNIGSFVENHIKHIETTYESYSKDTPDFFRTIQQINNSLDVLVTLIVKGLYTSIVPDEGLEAMETELNKRENQEVPTQNYGDYMERKKIRFLKALSEQARKC